jgi:hypothetical protein
MQKIKYHLIFIVLTILILLPFPVLLGKLVGISLDPIAIFAMLIIGSKKYDKNRLIKHTIFFILPLVAISEWIYFTALGDSSIEHLILKTLSLYILLAIANAVYILLKKNEKLS